MSRVEAVLVGAGHRGHATYGGFAQRYPEKLRFRAVAEPNPERRRSFADAHRIAPELCFAHWEELLAGPPLADAVVIATDDTRHVEPALAALASGHHVLLEKPMALDPLSCLRLVEAAERADRILQIGHVLRFAPFYREVARVLGSGVLGELVSVDLREHVAAWHMAHSYVRGKFRRRAEAAPILLAKSCHDLDLLLWFVGEPARRVASFGARSHFRRASAPVGAPARCSDGCPVQELCPHDAERFYLAPDEALAAAWPWSDLGADPSRAARRRALRSGRYGRCVYHCDNDVLDHQTLAVEFESGASASFGLHGFAREEQRTLRITGTGGELRGVLHEGKLELSQPGRLEVERREIPGSPIGHFGGDDGLVAHFVEAVESRRRGAGPSGPSSLRQALEAHLLGFAAEQARLEGRVVELAGFRRKIETPGTP